MKSEPDLWRRLAAFEIDANDADFPFSARLARDNQWPRAFACRVIEEYKRFAYLAMTAGAEVTPSDEVDQAWHLHLTYTRNYWDAFREALGAPLHHGPTKGGRTEKNRYLENYERTLKAYAEEFGAPPPHDIWPPSMIRFSRAPKMQRLCTEDYFMVPKQVLRKAGAGLAAGGAAVSLLLTSSYAAAASAGAGWKTPLAAFVLFALLALILFVGVRSVARSRKSGGSHGSAAGGAAGCGVTSGGGKQSDGSVDGGDGGSGCGGCGGCGG